MLFRSGSAVEQAPVRETFYDPRMPYTWGLLATIPQINAKRAALDPIPGAPPSLINLPAGCVFAPRCEARDLVFGDLCRTQRPALVEVAPGHLARCHLGQDQLEHARGRTQAGSGA